MEQQQQQQQQNVTGAGGRRLHIAHRRSPSELTPLMMEQLALQQQIEILQAQQQQMLSAHQQYANMGFVAPAGGPHLNPTFTPIQAPMPNISPQHTQGGFQFPQQHQQNAAPPGAPTQPSSHRRNQSAMPGMGGTTGPPPAPSSGSSGTFGEFSLGPSNSTGGNNNAPQRRPSGNTGGQGGDAGRGHQRRHSLALPEAKKAAELAQARRGQSGFQFPAVASTGPATSVANGSSPTAGGAGSPATAGSPPATGETPTTTAATTQSQTATANQPAALAPPRPRMGGHGRSQSVAVGVNGGSPVGGGRIGGFQFPPPMATSDAGAGSTTGNQGQGNQQQGRNVERRGSNSGFQGHNRTGSRNYDGNWRNQNQNQNQSHGHQQNQSVDLQNLNQNPGMGQLNSSFQPGHRSRASIGAFQFPAQPGLMLPGHGGQSIFINPATGQPQILSAGLLQQQQQLTQLQLQQAAINAQSLNLGNLGQASGQNMPNQQQQRKTLFTPYLPQASLPALLSNGQLVSGILRVNKKNRSDAYVSTQDGLLDADIFICGSKDRNRALEGDLVAVELLDVDEVWGQKREKEEKKKRKDISETRGPSGPSNNNAGGDGNSTNEGGQEGTGIKRRGSLRQRPTQKKNDDVEVEGQSLLLVEEEEVNDEQKPLFAGHIVAVIERVAGQMFSGTLGLLRPSSQATKEKQEAERQAREGHSGRPNQPERTQDKPKIVWFKPTDKRVPLIAIPTEQAPRDFVENHQSYANRIFVACIKRWPITSLHPFGTLFEQLGEMGDIKVETDALLRDNNFGPDDFSEAVIRNVIDNWSVETEKDEVIAARKDFRDVKTFSINAKSTGDISQSFHVNKASDTTWEIGVHIADVAHFVKPNSLVDREARKRGTGVELVNRLVPMLPQKLAEDLLSLKEGQDRFTTTVVFTVNADTDEIVEEETWVGKGIIRNSANFLYGDVDAIVSGAEGEGEKVPDEFKVAVAVLHKMTRNSRKLRYSAENMDIPALRLVYQLDDENIPVEDNIFETRPAYEIVEELFIRTNSFVAQKIAAGLPEKALLRRHSPPNQRRVENFAERMNRYDQNIDVSSSAALQTSLFRLKDPVVQQGMETVLIKGMQRAKYFVASKLPSEMHGHYLYNVPAYTHFTSPIRRYADIIVHRQLEAVLSNGAVDFTEDTEALAKAAEQCNVKKDSAKNAIEQSIHIELCRAVDRRRQSQDGELICEAIVINVYESAFDVLIPEYGFEKRVHCDQLPLKKAEFDKANRVLELYWEKGVQSNVYIPEDERPKGGAALRAANAAAAASQAAAAAKAAQEQEEIQRKMMEVSSRNPDAEQGLFDDEDDSNHSDGGVATERPTTLAPVAASTRPTQSMPGSPTKNSPTSSQTPHRTRSDPKISVAAHDNEKADGQEVSNEDKYLQMFTLREEKGDYIQEVRELTRVPVFLKTELSKSPPCLTIRSLNPYAL